MAWQTETIPAIRNVTAATNPVIAQASGPEATPEMLRAALAFQEARLEWLRVTRSAALTLSMANVEDMAKQSKEVQEGAKLVLMKLTQAADSLAQQGVATEAMVAAFRNGLASAVRTVGIAAEAADLKATEMSIGPGLEASQGLSKLLQDYGRVAEKAAEQSASNAALGAASARSLLLAIIAATLLTALGAAAWIAIGLSRGLNGALGLANAVARGDLSQSYQPRSNDEVADLVAAFNQMTANLNATAAVADAIAAGDLTVEAKRLSDEDRLGSPSRTCSGS